MNQTRKVWPTAPGAGPFLVLEPGGAQMPTTFRELTGDLSKWRYRLIKARILPIDADPDPPEDGFGLSAGKPRCGACSAGFADMVRIAAEGTETGKQRIWQSIGLIQNLA